MAAEMGVDAVRKTLRLLELMSARNGELTVTQIAERLDCSVSSANRFLQTMEQAGFVVKNRQTKRYELTYHLYALGSQMVDNDATVKKLISLAQSVSQKYDVSVNINSMYGGKAVLLFRVSRYYNKDLDFVSGETAPAYCTSSGKLFLAQMEPAQLDRYFAATEFSVFQGSQRTEKQLRQELEHVRQKGYATCQEEYVSGVFSYSLPARDASGHCYAFTLIMPLREKKRLFQKSVMDEIRTQLQKI